MNIKYASRQLVDPKASEMYTLIFTIANIIGPMLLPKVFTPELVVAMAPYTASSGVYSAARFIKKLGYPDSRAKKK